MVTQENRENEKVQSSEEKAAEEKNSSAEASTDSDDKGVAEETGENSAD